MKLLLIGEYREKKLLDVTYDLVGFANKFNGEKIMLAIGYESDLPKFDGKLYLADAKEVGEYNPNVHKKIILDVIEKEKPDIVVFIHSSFGWDLAPRVATSLNAAQFTEVVGYKDNNFVVPSCNSKLRRDLSAKSDITIVTIQAGAFTPLEEPTGTPIVENIKANSSSSLEFLGYEEAEAKGLDLTKAEIIVTAGRGIVTIQATKLGAFTPLEEPTGTPIVENIKANSSSSLEFLGYIWKWFRNFKKDGIQSLYEKSGRGRKSPLRDLNIDDVKAKGPIDLTKAEIIVTAKGRGIGKKDNVSIIQDLATKLGGI